MAGVWQQCKADYQSHLCSSCGMWRFAVSGLVDYLWAVGGCQWIHHQIWGSFFLPPPAVNFKAIPIFNEQRGLVFWARRCIPLLSFWRIYCAPALRRLFRVGNAFHKNDNKKRITKETEFQCADHRSFLWFGDCQVTPHVHESNRVKDHQLTLNILSHSILRIGFKSLNPCILFVSVRFVHVFCLDFVISCCFVSPKFRLNPQVV